MGKVKPLKPTQVLAFGRVRWRRFPVVEKQWRTACKAENENSSNDNLNYTVYPLLPTDSELAAALWRERSGEFTKFIS
ncbi:hypothetical protein CK203_105757 [Vitis vinifera]|uniref:Uncharacterized protein n=1 Tax=Vitis vinifera TaxID=29760 RepID=A0A438F6M5_VITVI|nr:hypothetical protein CK203_105757 [Vitis vinifera]